MKKSLDVVKEIISAGDSENNSYDGMIKFMSFPFARMFESIGIFANNSDAFEVTKEVVRSIITHISDFEDNRFLSSYYIYEPIVETIYTQAVKNYDEELYEIELARLRTIITEVKVIFSETLE